MLLLLLVFCAIESSSIRLFCLLCRRCWRHIQRKTERARAERPTCIVHCFAIENYTFSEVEMRTSPTRPNASWRTRRKYTPLPRKHFSHRDIEMIIWFCRTFFISFSSDLVYALAVWFIQSLAMSSTVRCAYTRFPFLSQSKHNTQYKLSNPAPDILCTKLYDIRHSTWSPPKKSVRQDEPFSRSN